MFLVYVFCGGDISKRILKVKPDKNKRFTIYSQSFQILFLTSYGTFGFLQGEGGKYRNLILSSGTFSQGIRRGHYGQNYKFLSKNYFISFSPRKLMYVSFGYANRYDF